MSLFAAPPAVPLFAHPRTIFRSLSSLCVKSCLQTKPHVYLPRLRRRRHYASTLPTTSFSTLVPTGRIPESVEVPCRSNGSILVNIFPPFSGPLFSPAIIYLPTGPLFENAPDHDAHVVTALRAASNATIVVVNYRTAHLPNGCAYRWPVPLHDVLSAFDWLIENAHSQPSPTTQFQRLGVCGQLFGGGLAATLSLTECGARLPHLFPARIAAAALNNPIVDWVEPDREAVEHPSTSPRAKDEQLDNPPVLKHKKSSRRKKLSSWEEFKDSALLSESALLRYRNTVFGKPDRYFDSFASPIHFFRTAGIDVPGDKSSISHDPDVNPAPQLRRKASLQFPSASSNVILPHIRLTTGQTSILRSQGVDFIDRITTKELRNSLKHQGISVKQYAIMEEDQPSKARQIRDEAEKKFNLNILEGSGLWGYGPEELWRSDVEAAGRWLKDTLTS